ncbi:metal-dependent hydrolase [Marilutibacter chinensis]|uniref:Metal-dependent hydrolase n=1 Tax=Marilutibacter chinensis TaxID=2912247 RepID=A0ABS9HTP4_9GAMM|nr:metal-dependent hydrolase [Lysobacter chinensis]MCF7222073.1 metal-dependent hydrolase [Lysobacter chinensis]
MPTIITHALVPLAAGIALGSRRIDRRLVLAGMAAAMLPDADVVAFALGIPYADAFGHRGASHSLLFAAVLGALAASFHRSLRAAPALAAIWIFACTLSHPLLDAFTDGGLGVALWWPWSHAREFAPWRPIEVSPIGAGFFSARGLVVLMSEARWVWLPVTALALAAVALRRTSRALSSRR